MPYRTISELPQSVRTALPEEAQRIFLRAFNAITAKDDVSETRAFKQAWGAVARAGWHAPAGGNGKWTNDEDQELDDSAPPADVADDGDTAVPPTQCVVVEPMTILDEAPYKPRRTQDGFLVAFSRAARSGIQKYKGAELGLPQYDDIRVYRPEAEVFARDSLASYPNRPVTNDHPPVLVDASNWRKYSVGHIGEDVVRDGEFVRVPLVLMDQDTIDDYESGKCELSLGYTMELVLQQGKTERGEIYDAIQTKIRANHLAVCASARGGPALRIGDDKAGDEIMTTKTITVDGLRVTLDERDADIVLRAIDMQGAEIKKLQKGLDDGATAIRLRDDQLSAGKKEIEARDAKIAMLEKQVRDSELTPQKLQTAVRVRSDVIAQAKKLAGDKIGGIDAMPETDIRRAVVALSLGDTVKDWSDDKVQAAFDYAVSQGKPSGSDPLGRILGDGVRQIHSAQDARDEAYTQMVKLAEDAWKPKQPAAR